MTAAPMPINGSIVESAEERAEENWNELARNYEIVRGWRDNEQPYEIRALKELPPPPYRTPAAFAPTKS